MNRLIKLIIVVLFIISVPRVKADTVFEIQTGSEDSASWQFVNLLSDIWKRKQVLQEKPQNKRSYFIPRHVEGFFHRFQNLNKRQCTLIIAPLKSITELPITGMKIKIAAVLWQSYLVPIGLNDHIENVELNGDQKWLIPKKSLIIPGFLNRLYNTFQDSSTDMDPELIKLVQSMTWPVPENKPDIGSFSNTGKLELIERKSISEILTGGSEAILFYEMIGPYENLENVLGIQTKILSLENNLIQKLLKRTWFLDPFTISKLDVKTVGVTYALFLHESEDSEFVKELLETLAQQPSSYFPKPYLLENLLLTETKVISPLFLHKSTIEFFHIE